ncbi:MAG: hypothetical protein AVDCRST_MAG91-1052, partial [uncultured Sphingomonadaceae bacterium]
ENLFRRRMPPQSGRYGGSGGRGRTAASPRGRGTWPQRRRRVAGAAARAGYRRVARRPGRGAHRRRGGRDRPGERQGEVPVREGAGPSRAVSDPERSVRAGAVAARASRAEPRRHRAAADAGARPGM